MREGEGGTGVYNPLRTPFHCLPVTCKTTLKITNRPATFILFLKSLEDFGVLFVSANSTSVWLWFCCLVWFITPTMHKFSSGFSLCVCFFILWLQRLLIKFKESYSYASSFLIFSVPDGRLGYLMSHCPPPPPHPPHPNHPPTSPAPNLE